MLSWGLSRRSKVTYMAAAFPAHVDNEPGDGFRRLSRQAKPRLDGWQRYLRDENRDGGYLRAINPEADFVGVAPLRE